MYKLLASIALTLTLLTVPGITETTQVACQEARESQRIAESYLKVLRVTVHEVTQASRGSGLPDQEISNRIDSILMESLGMTLTQIEFKYTTLSLELDKLCY